MPYNYYNKHQGARNRFGLFLVAIIIAAILMYNISYYQSATHVTIVVTGKERVTDRNAESSRYLIFTDRETFECTDLLFEGKFNSSDIYGRIKIGSTYTVRVMGWRKGFFSMYRNIVNITEEHNFNH